MRTICVAAILAALSLPASSADLMPSAIRALLDKGEAASLFQSIDEPSWTAFLTHIEAGDRGWIDLVPLLAPVADAGNVQRLTVSLSRALKTNPAGVLRVLTQDHFSAAQVCIGNEAQASQMDAVRFIDEALVKVAAVMDPALSQARNACLHELGDARISTLI